MPPSACPRPHAPSARALRRCEKSLHERQITHVVSGKPDSNGVKRARTQQHPTMQAVGLRSAVKVAVSAAPQRATPGSYVSYGCVLCRLEAALHTRAKRPVLADPTDGP